MTSIDVDGRRSPTPNPELLTDVPPDAAPQAGSDAPPDEAVAVAPSLDAADLPPAASVDAIPTDGGIAPGSSSSSPGSGPAFNAPPDDPVAGPPRDGATTGIDADSSVMPNQGGDGAFDPDGDAPVPVEEAFGGDDSAASSWPASQDHNAAVGVDEANATPDANPGFGIDVGFRIHLTGPGGGATTRSVLSLLWPLSAMVFFYLYLRGRHRASAATGAAGNVAEEAAEDAEDAETAVSSSG